MMRAALPVAVWLLAGCGGVASTSGSDSSPARTASQSTPPVGWATFSSPKLGYTINLPTSLCYEGSTGGPYPSDYFSNDGAGAPEQMDHSGIFFTVVVTADVGDQCLQHGLRGQTIDRHDAVTLDGNGGSLKVLTFRSVGGNWPSMVMNSLHSGHCYQFDFISMSQAVRDANEATAVQILGSFRFGSGPVPTP